MSAHVRPDDAPMLLPGFGPSPLHEALAAVSRAADAACSRAAMGCSRNRVFEDLAGVVRALDAAYLVLLAQPAPIPVDKSGGP